MDKQTILDEIEERKEKFFGWARSIPTFENAVITREFVLNNMEKMIGQAMLSEDPDLQKFLREEIQLTIKDETRLFGDWARCIPWMNHETVDRDFVLNNKERVMISIDSVTDTRLQVTLRQQLDLIVNDASKMKYTIDVFLDRVILSTLEDQALKVDAIQFGLAVIMAKLVRSAKAKDTSSFNELLDIILVDAQEHCIVAFLAWLRCFSSTQNADYEYVRNNKAKIDELIDTRTEPHLHRLLVEILKDILRENDRQINPNDSVDRIRQVSTTILAAEGHDDISDAGQALKAIGGPVMAYLRRTLQLQEVFVKFLAQAESPRECKQEIFRIYSAYYDGYGTAVLAIPIHFSVLEPFAIQGDLHGQESDVASSDDEDLSFASKIGEVVLEYAVHKPGQAISTVWRSIFGPPAQTEPQSPPATTVDGSLRPTLLESKLENADVREKVEAAVGERLEQTKSFQVDLPAETLPEKITGELRPAKDTAEETIRERSPRSPRVTDGTIDVDIPTDEVVTDLELLGLKATDTQAQIEMDVPEGVRLIDTERGLSSDLSEREVPQSKGDFIPSHAVTMDIVDEGSIEYPRGYPKIERTSIAHPQCTKLDSTTRKKETAVSPSKFSAWDRDPPGAISPSRSQMESVRQLIEEFEAARLLVDQ